MFIPGGFFILRVFLLDTKENPRLCRGDTKAYGVEESKKEKVSKLE